MPKEYFTYIRKGIYENTLTEMMLDIIKLLNIRYNINIDIDVDYEQDRTKILNELQTIEKNNSIENKFPKLVEEWNNTKNGNLKPAYFSYASNKKVWWKCSKCGHEWETKINSRTSLGTGCPICGRNKATQNRKSISNERLLKNNEIMKEYNYDKNQDLDLNIVTIGSKKKIWWKCSKCENEWQAQIYTRVKGFGKCPKCK